MKSIRAVVERPELWQVSINGNEVSEQDEAFWIDKDFPQFAIGEFLKSREKYNHSKGSQNAYIGRSDAGLFVG